MASDAVVGWALAILKHLPSKNPVTAETVAFYALGLEDLTDQQLREAVRLAARDCTFLPTPAELSALVGANRPAFVDCEAVLARIAGMASYLPTSGTSYPRVEAVRGALGDAVAEAYGIAGGGERLFSGNETTRAISRREFRQEVEASVKERGAGILPPAQALLPSAPYTGPVIYGERPKLSGPQPIAKLLTQGRGCETCDPALHARSGERAD